MDEQILDYLKKNGRSPTWHMRSAGIAPCSDLRRRLRKMLKEGVVKLSPLSSTNNLLWELPPNAEVSGGLTRGGVVSDYYIVSVCHTQRRHQYVTLWRPDNKGYAWPLEWAGKYNHETVMADLGYYNSGCSNIAVRADVIAALAVPPKPGTIDGDAGPVVLNTRANWKLILANVIAPTQYPPRPEFKGAPRAREAA